MDLDAFNKSLDLCSRVPINTTYYNVSFSYEHPEGQLVTTYTQIFASLQSQVINNILIGNILFLVLVIAVIEVTRGKCPSWIEIIKARENNQPIENVSITVLRTIATICLPIALFSVLLLISLKLGLNW